MAAPPQQQGGPHPPGVQRLTCPPPGRQAPSSGTQNHRRAAVPSPGHGPPSVKAGALDGQHSPSPRACSSWPPRWCCRVPRASTVSGAMLSEVASGLQGLQEGEAPFWWVPSLSAPPPAILLLSLLRSAPRCSGAAQVGQKAEG